MKNRAVTLAEIVIATTIMVFVLMGILSVYFMISDINDYETIRTNELNESYLAMERILRGPAGNDGLREAILMTINSPSDISFTTLSGVTKRFYLSNNKIYYSPSGEVIADDVSSLVFAGTSKYVDITVVFSKIFRDKTLKLELTRSVKARN